MRRPRGGARDLPLKTQDAPLTTDVTFSQTVREELANAASHGLGGLLALAATPVLAADLDAATHPMRWLGTQVFIATMLLMFAVSTVYHAVPVGQLKVWLRKCDHAVIFVFIAGSYTPFALGHMQRGGGWDMLAAVWAIALTGVALKLGNRLRHPLWSTLLYLAFGWMVLVVARPMIDGLPPTGRTLLIAGGVAYTLGSLFFLIDRRMRYSHFVWHLFVITGSSCHFLAVQHAIT
jgi:hemolysin III